VKTPPVVGLFVTCAIDLIRPLVGHASAKLLVDAGCALVVPRQTCCGQVGFNNGLPDETRRVAERTIAAFADTDYVVVPSGSCASMLKNHYPRLFDDPDQRATAQAFADKVYELTCFLVDVLKIEADTGNHHNQSVVAYHDSCAGLRELGIKHQPRQLAREYRGVHLTDIPDGDTCCGFGGTFCVKFPAISDQMVTAKIENILSLQPDMVLGGDLTCLLNIAGKLQTLGHSDIEVRHIAEFLAEADDHPAIGCAE
jgi:L-lactate dehydrogenase complex protein LldE